MKVYEKLGIGNKIKEAGYSYVCNIYHVGIELSFYKIWNSEGHLYGTLDYSKLPHRAVGIEKQELIKVTLSLFHFIERFSRMNSLPFPFAGNGI